MPEQDEGFGGAANEAGPRELFRPDRLLAFSDGVFGVAITLLVIDIRLPTPSSGSGELDLLPKLAALAPNLVVFAFTFVVVGMSWMGHHRKFSCVDRIDGWVLWINLSYLMALCLVPFVSAVLAEYNDNRFAFTLYAGVMAVVDVLSAALSAYCLRPPFLKASEGLQRARRQDMIFSPFLTAIIFAISAALAIGGLARVAHWSLLAIVPARAFLGRRAARVAVSEATRARATSA